MNKTTTEQIGDITLMLNTTNTELHIQQHFKMLEFSIKRGLQFWSGSIPVKYAHQFAKYLKSIAIEYQEGGDFWKELHAFHLYSKDRDVSGDDYLSLYLKSEEIFYTLKHDPSDEEPLMKGRLSADHALLLRRALLTLRTMLILED